MWDRHLDHTRMAKHRVELVQRKTAPVNVTPYQVDATMCDLEKAEIDNVLSKKFIERAQIEWAAAIVFVFKKEVTLQFWVDYREFNAVAKRNTYPIPRMDECIDLLGKAANDRR